ncbi:hypothetical protein [Thermovibrio ammonificans]|jgi:hypothetical protein
MAGERRPFFVYLLVLSGAGVLYQSPALAPTGLGLSLFVPALFNLALRGVSLPAVLFGTAVVEVLLALLNPQVALDVGYFPFLGLLFYLFKERPAAAVLSGAALLFGGSLIEELLFGLPKEVTQFKEFMALRLGIYAYTALLVSVAAYGLTLLLERRGELFFKLKFGFWTAVFFIVSAAASLLLKGSAKVVSENFLIASLGFLTAQGIPVFFHFVRRFSPLMKLIIFFAVLIFPLGFLATALVLGLLDNWFDFRKLKGGEEDGSNPA